MTRQPFGARLYRRLLRLYPREFREEYGAEMAGLYRVMLALVATLACYLPAARATRIDPIIALRTE